MNATTAQQAEPQDAHQDEDATANRAIRGVASTPSQDHIIPAEVIAALYAHVDEMRAAFFGEQLPEVVLSFDVTDRRTLGHYHLRRNGLGVRWAVNLNPVPHSSDATSPLPSRVIEVRGVGRMASGHLA